MIWLAAIALVAQTRIASDFEIAQMKQQLATSRDFLSQLSGNLNLGDLYLTRSETATARSYYSTAASLADQYALAARKDSDITRYATAVAYRALADAKLGNEASAFTSAEEAIRYTSGSAKSWNLYSTAMTLLSKPVKAVSAARNAVTIASREVAASPSVANRLDLAVYQYSLASSLIESGNAAEAERLLRTVTTSLRSNDFASLRRDVARNESFEIYSSARGDQAAYLSLVNRAGLRLAALLEQRGDLAGARREYENVLAARTDDPTALAALARLSPPEEQERYFAAAFDANPFSLPLIREYQQHIQPATSTPADETTGAKVRSALIQMKRDEMRAARQTLDALLRQFPNNDTLNLLRRETEATARASSELREILAQLQSNQMTPEQRAALDQKTFTSVATFDALSTTPGQTIISSGTIDDVRFRFSEPTAFNGTFSGHAHLTYRILGATEIDGADALLLEPVRIEP